MYFNMIWIATTSLFGHAWLANGKYIRLLIQIFFLFILLMQCEDGFREVEQNGVEDAASIYLDNFTRESSDLNGNKKWLIHAKKAFVYLDGSDQSRLIVYNFQFTEYDDTGKMRNTVTANRGEIDYTQKLLYLDGQVVSQNTFGRTVRSEKMQFNMETKIFTSNVEVHIIDKFTSLICANGARIDMENNKQVCLGPTVIKQETNEPQENAVDLDIFQ